MLQQVSKPTDPIAKRAECIANEVTKRMCQGDNSALQIATWARAYEQAFWNLTIARRHEA